MIPARAFSRKPHWTSKFKPELQSPNVIASSMSRSHQLATRFPRLHGSHGPPHGWVQICQLPLPSEYFQKKLPCAFSSAM